jgi:U3 small nucleolar ribonucleoprotein protein IMP3
LAERLKKLPPSDTLRIELSDKLLDKLYNLGVINTKSSLSQCDALTASAFCRRRLPVVMVRLKMAQNLRQAITLIEHGHVRVGPQVVDDPAFHVTRVFEDFVTWVDSSKIRRHIAHYRDNFDEYEFSH